MWDNYITVWNTGAANIKETFAGWWLYYFADFCSVTAYGPVFVQYLAVFKYYQPCISKVK